MALALNDAKTVLPDVRILRSVGDETLLGQFRRETMIEMGIAVGIGRIAGPPFQTVLADHHRPLLAGLDVLWHEQDSIRVYTRPNVEGYFVAAELRTIVN